MKISAKITVFLLAAGLLLPKARAQDAPTTTPAKAPATAEQITHWVRQLGDDSFLVREEATRQLIAAGPVAEHAVTGAIQTNDPEVRYRALKILKEIERGQLAQRRALFLEGDVEQMRINAASWKRLEEMVGNTRASRELFLAMQQDAEELLNELEQTPERVGPRVMELYQQEIMARRGGKVVASGLVYAMVFAGADERVTLDANAISRSVSLLTRHRATGGVDKNEAFRVLLGRWLLRDVPDNQRFQLLRLAQQFELKEGAEIARKIIAGGSHVSLKAQALVMLGQIGGPEDVAGIEKLIGDETSIGATRRVGDKAMECRFGDVALAMCLVLSEQRPSEFGFAGAPEGRPAAFNYTLYAFESDDARKAARQKWTEFRAAQQEQSK